MKVRFRLLEKSRKLADQLSFKNVQHFEQRKRRGFNEFETETAAKLRFPETRTVATGIVA